MKLQTGDILLHKGQRWTSKIIRWFTKSPYTHVAIVFDNDRVLEIDINKKLSIYEVDQRFSYEVYRHIDGLTDETKNIMKAKMVERKTTLRGYDWMKIFSLGLSKVLRKPFFLDMKNYVICSEIVDMIYSDIGIDLIPEAVIGHITPNDIAGSPCLKVVGVINE